MGNTRVSTVLVTLCCLFRRYYGISQYQSWAKDFVFGSDSTRQSLRPIIAESLGVHFCRDYPDTPVMENNLAGHLLSQPMNGWKGNNLKSLKSKFGFETVKAENINSKADGPELNLTGLGPGNYLFSFWAKLESSDSKESSLVATIRSTGEKLSSGRVIATAVAKTACWTKVSGGFTILDSSIKSQTVQLAQIIPGSSVSLAAVYIKGKNQSTYYQEQNQLISMLRKRDVSLKVLDKNGNPFNGFVEVDQVENDFPFGGSISAIFVQSESFRRWFKKRFNWAVFEQEVEWSYVEPTRGVWNYNRPDELTSLLLDMNISIRGHAAVLEFPGNAMNWLKALPPAGVEYAVTKHIQEVVTRYKGKFRHWDCLNEFLHNSFMENITHDRNLATVVHKAVKAADPNVLAFFNEYNVVEGFYYYPNAPEALLAAVQNIEKHGGVVDRLGIEGHFGYVDGPQVRAQFDKLAVGGKLIWLTELDDGNPLPSLQADYIELVLREAFSHPIVEGIVLWGPARPGCTEYNADYSSFNSCLFSLVDGDIVERPLGLRYLKLRKEWSTHRSQVVNNGVMNFRGFFGEYQIRIYDGENDSVQTFYVPKGPTELKVTVKAS